jgi:hypothetical protein
VDSLQQSTGFTPGDIAGHEQHVLVVQSSPNWGLATTIAEARL